MFLKIGALFVLALALTQANQVRVNKLRERLHGKNAVTNKPVIKAVLNALGKGKQIQDGMTFTKRKDKTKKFTRIVHLQQEFEGLQVFGYGATVQEISAHKVQKDGKTIDIADVTIINGKYVEGLQTVVQKGDAQKLQRVKARMLSKVKADHKKKGKAEKNDFPINLPDDATPIIYVKDNVAVQAFLVRFVDRFSAQPSFPNFIVDVDGKILEQYEGLNTRDAVGPGGNDKIGRFQYPDIPITDHGNGRCSFDTENVKTVDLFFTSNTGKDEAFEFDCYENVVREVNGGYSPMNDAQFYGSKVFEFYNVLYDSDPLEEKPLKLNAHYSRNFDNAFFDGSSMTFGDGYTLFYPLTSLDVVAHEVAHGVTDQTSGLIYSGQSGGLNEAFSDMSGKAVERYIRGYAATSWGLGIDITKGDRGLRCMDDPPCDGQSIDHTSDYFDGLDVHYSSGVYNKAFYLVSINAATAEDIKTAYDIFYLTNTQYWGRSTGYAEGAELTLQAVSDMRAGLHLSSFDHSTVNIDVVTAAFEEVGITCTDNGTSYDCTAASRK